MLAPRAALLGVSLLLCALPALAQDVEQAPPAPAEPATQTKSNPAAGANDDALARMRTYQEALATRKLGPHLPLSKEAIQERVTEAESLLDQGRTTEGTMRLSALVAHPKFNLFKSSNEGFAAQLLLADALARGDARDSAIAMYLQLANDSAAWSARGSAGPAAVRRIADLAIRYAGEGARTQLSRICAQLAKANGLFDSASQSELAYLNGRKAEIEGDAAAALSAYASLPQTSRHWAQAVYRQGLLQASKGDLQAAENLFCKVAEPTPARRTLPLYADAAFFSVRDMARLALGRVAHEQQRQDDARYYYYLVPQDSARLPEALYEAATTRYEKKDYEGASDLLNELRALGADNAYADEAEVLAVYVDLASCKFAQADTRLRKFIADYEPIRNQVQNLLKAPQPRQALRDVEHAQLRTAGGGRIMRELARDPALGATDHRLATLDELVANLGGTAEQATSLGRATQVLASTPKSAAPDGDEGARSESNADALARELRSARRALESARAAGARDLGPDFERLQALERASTGAAVRAEMDAANVPASDGSLEQMLTTDGVRAAELRAALIQVRTQTSARADAQYLAALKRLDERLARLLRRAGLARIEAVLGLKRGLELEVEAIASGYLPKDAIDSVAPERFLSDREEYWPFEGDDWADEFVGSEESR